MKKLTVMKVGVTLLSAMALTLSVAPRYESPTVRATASIGAANGDTHPHFMNKAADDSVLTINLNADGDKVGTVFVFRKEKVMNRRTMGMVSPPAPHFRSGPS